MSRRAQHRPENTVRVQFEATRMSERVMADAYEHVVPVRQRRCRPGTVAPPEAPAAEAKSAPPFRR
jgi:hypothetical protein